MEPADRSCSTASSLRTGDWSPEPALCHPPAPAMQRALCVRADNANASRSDAVWRWRPRGCALKIYSSVEACALLHRIGPLWITGESFERHLYQGVINVLSADYEGGAVEQRRVLPPFNCTGEDQFDEKTCRAPRDLVIDPVASCPHAMVRFFSNGWGAHLFRQRGFNAPNFELMTRDVTATLTGALRMLPPMNDLSAAPPKQMAAPSHHPLHHHKGGPGAVVVGLGFHDQLNATLVTAALRSIAQTVRTRHNSSSTGGGARRPRLVYVSMHALGGRVRREYADTYANNPTVRAFNAEVNAAARALHFEVLETFNLTISSQYSSRPGGGAESFPLSFDGTHYGRGVNVLKAQHLLRFLEEGAQHQEYTV
jgi:hypothetical protein